MHSETHSDTRSSPENKWFLVYWKFSWKQHAISSRVNATRCTEVEVTEKVNENRRTYTKKNFILCSRKQKKKKKNDEVPIVKRVWVWRTGNRVSISSSHRRFSLNACTRTASGDQADPHPIHRTVNWPLRETDRSESSTAKAKQSLYRRLSFPDFETVGT
jgi:hypothetical protein